jgi:heme oxygenase (biliverdin-IX-beta and delta-forming)
VFIQNLREATAASHKQLEQNYLSALLVSDKVTTTIYTAYLLKLYPFVSGFETNIFPFLKNAVHDIEQRKKAHLLKADIEDAGVDITDAEIIRLNFFSENYTGFYEALGAMYVLEGSTLGGQIIQKHLQKIFGEGFGSKYFTAYN